MSPQPSRVPIPFSEGAQLILAGITTHFLASWIGKDAESIIHQHLREPARPALLRQPGWLGYLPTELCPESPARLSPAAGTSGPG